MLFVYCRSLGWNHRGISGDHRSYHITRRINLYGMVSEKNNFSFHRKRLALKLLERVYLLEFKIKRPFLPICEENFPRQLSVFNKQYHVGFLSAMTFLYSARYFYFK